MNGEAFGGGTGLLAWYLREKAEFTNLNYVGGHVTKMPRHYLVKWQALSRGFSSNHHGDGWYIRGLSWCLPLSYADANHSG